MSDASNDEQLSTTYRRAVDNDPLEPWHVAEQEWVYFMLEQPEDERPD